MDTPITNEKESLKIIQEMIEKTKRRMGKGSGFLLLWGWVVLLTCLTEFVLLEVFRSPWHFVVWLPAIVIGFTGTWILSRRAERDLKVKTFVSEAMNYVWISFTVTLFIVLFLSVHISWSYIYIIILTLYGLGTFITGGLIRFKPLMVGGVLSWALAIAGILLPFFHDNFAHMLLLTSAAIVVSYLIPGYLLKKFE